MIRVCGLDLSLSGCALCTIPAGWGGDWQTIRSTRLPGIKVANKAPERERIDRIQTLARGAVGFVRDTRATHVWFEQYAFGRNGANARLIAEVGGAIKLALRQLDVPVDAVVASSARKVVFGRCPQKDPKPFIQRQLEAWGCELPTHDERDAFVVASYGLSELGEPTLLQTETEK